ncbi:MAG: WD40/YVTN/BNR-like repeat-containing protein, partial [Ignavibacterium sp.]
MKINYISFLLLFILYGGFYQINSQNFWQGVLGPEGSVQHCAINSNGDIFICGGCGLLKSTDDGESWIGAQPGNYSETAITINSFDHIFVGTPGDGIFRSEDNGQTWTQINNGLSNFYVYSLAVHQNGDIYAGLVLYLNKSTNNGNSWSLTNLAASNIITLAIDSGGIIFAGASTLGVYKSIDNGATWSICNNGLTTAVFFKLGISPSNDIYLGTVYNGAFRSTDEGNSWVQIGLSNYQVQCFAFSPGGEIFVGTNDGVFKSTDNGENWIHISSDG